jgi:hypothetical protein
MNGYLTLQPYEDPVAEDAQAFPAIKRFNFREALGNHWRFFPVIYGQRVCSFPKAVALVTQFDKIRADCRVEHPARVQPSTSLRHSASLILSKQSLT